MPQAPKIKKYEDVLMSALRFSEEDLTANESGTFSAGQVINLKNRRSTQAIIIGSMCGIVAMLLLFANVYAGGLAPLVIVFLIFVALALLIGGIRALQITRDLQAGIRAAEGRVELDMTPGQNSAAYYVKVDGKKFKVKKRVFLAFKNGDPYRVYYTPHTKTILSVEWLRDDNPFEESDTSRLEDAPIRTEPADELDRLLRDEDTR